MGKGNAMFTTNELVFIFGGFFVCANFGENPSRNASVRVHADGHTDTRTHEQRQTGFIICSILYDMVMGHIITTTTTTKLTHQQKSPRGLSF